jgi:hypothetical protein
MKTSINVNIPLQIVVDATTFVTGSKPEDRVTKFRFTVLLFGSQIDYSREGEFKTEGAALRAGKLAAREWARRQRSHA